MVKDLGDGDSAVWQFDGTAVSQAVLGALRDKQPACVANSAAWMPTPGTYRGTEPFCGTGGEGGRDSFVYTNGTGCTQPYAGWYLQLDGDTGCYNAAFKLGMPHTGY